MSREVLEVPFLLLFSLVYAESAKIGQLCKVWSVPPHKKKRPKAAENNKHETKRSYVKSIETKIDKCEIHRQKCSMSTCYALIHCPKSTF